MFKSLIEYKSFDLPNLIVDADCLLMMIQVCARDLIFLKYFLKTLSNVLVSPFTDSKKWLFLWKIQARSRLNLEGEFRFSTTRNMERDEIASSLDNDMKVFF